ncbi:A-agglutinin anchorage subunit [Fagus crenata]
MDFHLNHRSTNSPSSSASSTTSSNPNPPTTITATTTTTATASDPMHSWWESVSKARSRIHALSSILSNSSPSSSSFSFSSLADSDRPALSLLSSPTAYSLVSSALSSPHSGSGADPLCQWLYDTYLSSDPHLQLVVLSFLPLISALYLSRIHSEDSLSLPSLAGFEAVLLALYASETKSRNGKPMLISIPDLSQPSLYHTPRRTTTTTNNNNLPSVGVLSLPLEPQIAVKSTKRACIVGVALDCYYKQISQMPSWSKLEFCKSVAAWAGQDCPCKREFDQDDEFVNCTSFSDSRSALEDSDEIQMEGVVEQMKKLGIQKYDNGNSEKPKGNRIPLPWELLQPALRILGHCLLAPLNSQDVKDEAAVAVRCLYARASHDLVPQAILATRSLIQLDKRSRAAAKVEAAAAVASANASSNSNTPSKAKKPEILLVSK